MVPGCFPPPPPAPHKHRPFFSFQLPALRLFSSTLTFPPKVSGYWFTPETEALGAAHSAPPRGDLASGHPPPGESRAESVGSHPLDLFL